MKFFLVAGIFDKPAKAAVLNMNASNGFYGCTKCLQKGKSLKKVTDGTVFDYFNLKLLLNFITSLIF